MPETVFVTGASGFIGSTVIDQLLESGYRVRAAARGERVESLRKAYADVPALEVVAISDIIQDQFPEALQGVDAVIHIASPLQGKAEELFTGAIKGSLNVIIQAERAGIKKIVVTGSMASIKTPLTSKDFYTDKDWNEVTKEYALATGNEHVIYISAKKDAELAVWKWADAHPHVEVTTINPTYVYGPFGDRFAIPKPDYKLLSTNNLVYQLITPAGKWPLSPKYVDVRDVARAHVGALRSPPTAQVGRKRLLFVSPHDFNYQKTKEMIARERPELKNRLIRAEVPKHNSYSIDYDRIELLVGMKKEDFHSLESTMLDTLDYIVKLESEWKQNGYTITEDPPSL